MRERKDKIGEIAKQILNSENVVDLTGKVEEHGRSVKAFSRTRRDNHTGASSKSGV